MTQQLEVCFHRDEATHLSSVLVKHEIGGVPIAKPKDVANHAHDSQAAREISAALEPHLTISALQPKYFVKIETGSLLKSVAKHLNFFDKGQMLKVRCHLQYDAVFYGHQRFLAVAVVFDEGV